jgi:hypothetical protein
MSYLDNVYLYGMITGLIKEGKKSSTAESFIVHMHRIGRSSGGG